MGKSYWKYSQWQVAMKMIAWEVPIVPPPPLDSQRYRRRQDRSSDVVCVHCKLALKISLGIQETTVEQIILKMEGSESISMNIEK